MTSILLTGAGGSAAANLQDALSRSSADYRIVGADSSPVRLHLSRAHDRVVIPLATEVEYPDQVIGVVARYGIDVVLPQPDPEVLAIGTIRERLGARTFLPSQQALIVAADKAAFAERMSAASVAVPESATFESEQDVRDIVDELLRRHERLWVRARRGAGSRASLPVRTTTQAESWMRWWIEERGMSFSDFMVSEMLPGREFAYQSLWQDGELVAGQTRERVEYLYGHLTPSGQTSTPSVARTVREPDVDAVAEEAIRALDADPTGVFCVDIKESADGKPMVTEVNAGRFFTTSNFFAAAGLNMPDMLVRCALGERPSRVGSSPLPPDLYWIRMVDMGYALVSGDDLDTWPRAGR